MPMSMSMSYLTDLTYWCLEALRPPCSILPNPTCTIDRQATRAGQLYTCRTFFAEDS